MISKKFFVVPVIFQTLALLAMVGCAIPADKPAAVDEQKDDGRVTLGQARSLAHASYMLGCVEAKVELGKKKGSHELCKKRADDHLKVNVDRFFDDQETTNEEK